SGGEDSTIKLWDVSSDELVWDAPHGASIKCIDFSPDGSFLASGDNNGSVQIRNITTGKSIRSLIGHNPEESISSLAFSPDRTILASAGKTEIILWNMLKGVESAELHKLSEDVWKIAFSPDGNKIACCDTSSNGMIYFENLETKINDDEFHGGYVDSVAFSPDGSLLVSAGESIKIWNVTQDELVSVGDPITEGRVYSVDFSPNGSWLAAGFDEIIRIWHVENWTEVILPFDDHEGEVISVKFSPDGGLLASTGRQDGTIKLRKTTTNWEITDELIWNSAPDMGFGFVQSLVFSIDSSMLAAGGSDWNMSEAIRVWNITQGTGQKMPYHISNLNGEVYSVDFSADCKVLASANFDGSEKNGTVNFWNVTTGKLLYSFPEETNPVWSLAFSANKLNFASSVGRNLIFWALDSIPSDYDGDGMSDDWENDYDFLNILDWSDKFGDSDIDGLINSLECFLGTIPDKNDSDDDKMPDGWEYFHQLNATMNDALLDRDSDGMSNYYEYVYRQGLNPLYDDSAEDYDHDNLTNLQEFQNGWLNPFSNDTDGDLMPDPWEVQMGLNGSDPRDATGDKDHDGMENLWEYQNGFNASNSLDAYQDPDGDWVRNVDESKGKSDPHDFWSVPLLSFSAVHFLLGFTICIAIGIGFIAMKGFLIFREKQRIALTNQLGAPNYATAVKIQQLKLKNYAELQVEVDKAKDLIAEGNISYIRGQLPPAIQLYQQALKQYSSYMDDPLLAETVFNIARVQKELGILSPDEPDLSYFPHSQVEVNLTVKAFHNMLEGLLAEEKKNWGLANQAWHDAMDFKDLKTKYKAICQGALVNLDFRDWLNNPIPPDHEKLVVEVNKWQEFCKNNGLNDSLCWSYLTHARIALAAMQFDEAEELFNDCLKTAEQHQILYYQEIALRETEVFEKHKRKIYALTREGEPLSPAFQTQLIQEYLIKAKTLVQEEDLKQKEKK
ncbi:MAG: hypothetical protein ACFFDC_20140, partial [Promethearchaeota archaeon]